MNSKINAFLDFFDYLIKNCKEPVVVPEEVQEMYDILRSEKDIQNGKPMFTESGLQILEYMQSQTSKNFKSKDIAEGLCISSRKVSGAVRKLVTDGYVDKISVTSPVIYTLTEKGRNFNIKEYKETIEQGE